MYCQKTENNCRQKRKIKEVQKERLKTRKKNKNLSTSQYLENEKAIIK